MRRRPDLIAALLVALLVSGLGLPRVEMCVGADGHVALEPVGAACCDEAKSEASLAADGHCAAGCVDTPLQLSLAAPGSEHQHTAPPMVAVIGAPPELIGGRLPTAARRLIGTSPIAPPRTLRTTVLLC